MPKSSSVPVGSRAREATMSDSLCATCIFHTRDIEQWSRCRALNLRRRLGLFGRLAPRPTQMYLIVFTVLTLLVDGVV
jgi:hypothetical protein